jgi:hypothetical protein
MSFPVYLRASASLADLIHELRLNALGPRRIRCGRRKERVTSHRAPHGAPQSPPRVELERSSVAGVPACGGHHTLSGRERDFHCARGADRDTPRRGWLVAPAADCGKEGAVERRCR